MDNYSTLRRTFSLTLIVFALLLAGFACVSAEDVDLDGFKVSVVEDDMDLGEALEIRLTFEGPGETLDNAEMTLEVEVDGVQVHYDDEFQVDLVDNNDSVVTVSSNNFKNEDGDDVWTGLLMDYDCGDHSVKVKVGGGDLADDFEETDEYEVGRSAKTFGSVKTSMSNPTLDEDLTVTVTDEDDDDYEDGAAIRLVWLSDRSPKGEWNADDQVYSTTTKSDGTKSIDLKSKFGDDAFGMYRLDVYDESPQYCLHTINFNVSNALQIGNPLPSTPKVGEAFRVNITKADGKPMVGISVVANGPGGVILTGRTGADGSVSFTVSAGGEYTLVVGGSGTDYDLVTKTINISTRPPLVVTVDPATQEAGKPVEIMVRADGNPVSGATVKVARTGQTPVTLPDTTSTQGKVTYTPTESGDYTVKAEKATFSDGTGTFSVPGKLVIEVPQDEELKKGSEVLVTVKSSDGRPVEGASVSVEGRSIAGTTDANGLFRFTVADVGEHKIAVSKAGYSTSRMSLLVGGKLRLALSVTEVEFGGSITFTITDQSGLAIESDIRITRPDGVIFSDTASTYTYTPDRVGVYTVEVQKQSYSKTSANFTVTPKPLSLEAVFDGDRLMVNASSRDKPVANMEVKVSTPAGGNKTVLKTDSSGMAFMNAPDPGNYTIEADGIEYVKKTTVAEKTESILSGLLIPLIILLVVLAILIIIAIIIIHLTRGRSRGQFGKKKNSRLGG